MGKGETYSAEDIRALIEASVSLTSELTLDTVLQKVVDVARAQIGAKYAALSVLDGDGGIQRFVTSGITEEERAAIGDIPAGHGLLSVLLHAGTTLRMDDLDAGPTFGRFPAESPTDEVAARRIRRFARADPRQPLPDGEGGSDRL